MPGDWSQGMGIDAEIKMTDLTVLGKAVLYELAVSLANQEGLACFETCTKVKCPHLCPPVMVPLLVYCYATDVYGSGEIEDLSFREENIQRLSGEKWVQTAQIRCFRREHRGLLRKCLSELIREVRARSGAMVQSSQLAGGASVGRTSEAEDCELEAEARIQLAIRFDSMELDA